MGSKSSVEDGQYLFSKSSKQKSLVPKIKIIYIYRKFAKCNKTGETTFWIESSNVFFIHYIVSKNDWISINYYAPAQYKVEITGRYIKILDCIRNSTHDPHA